MNNWYVITGGPSSGKTTMVELLARQGYVVEPEMARVYIDEELGRGRSIADIRANELEFQRHILRLKIEREQQLPKNNLIFFDRGIPDSVAYYKICGVNIDPELDQAVQACSYKKVFLLDMPEYKQDYARVESPEVRQQIHDYLFDAYNNLGVPIVRVPIANQKADRVQFILENIQL